MQSFDYVIVGAGAAGCVLAARLSEDPARSVLLLEAGGKDDGLWIGIPAGFSKLLVKNRFNWSFETEPEDNVHGRRIVVPRGKGLGGSTLINGMIYVRGQAEDFDTWAQAGATGWGFQDVEPYFKKLEDYPEGGAGRGHGGPAHISRVSVHDPLADAFIEAGHQAGYPVNADYNDGDQAGFGYYQATQKGGRRWSAADAYLRPALSRPNLRIETDAQATGIALAEGRAKAVLYRQGGVERQAPCRGEIILACGAVQSPHLLELSGIGDPAILQAAGIAVRHSLPGVGANYGDHYCTRMNWRIKNTLTLNERTRGWRLAASVLQYALLRRGILTLGTGLAHGFVKTRPELLTPDVQYFFMSASYSNAATRLLDSKPGMTIGVAQLRPESRGTIHVTKTDPFAPPAIRPNFLATPTDRQTLMEGMRIAREVVGQPAMRPYLDHEMSPGEAVQTDEQWTDFARANGQTIYHPVGTCRMGGGPDAVVDARLRVHGIAGLRVVDASIMPSIVSANTQAATMMIAEKGADLIKADAKSG